MAANSLNSRVAATSLTRGSGLIEYTGANFNSKSWHDSAEQTFSAAVAAGNYLSWKITIASGYKLNNLRLKAEVDRSGTGPDTFAWAIDSPAGQVSCSWAPVSPHPTPAL